MKTLKEHLSEGLLDSNLDSTVDKALDSKVAQVLMSELKKIKWDTQYEGSDSGSRIYRAKDQDKALKLLLQTIKKVVKVGQDCKYPYRTPFSKIQDSFIVSVMDDKEWPYIVFANPHLPDMYYIMRHYYDDGNVVYQTSMDDRAVKDASIRSALTTGVHNAGLRSHRDGTCTNLLIPIPLWEPIKKALQP